MFLQKFGDTVYRGGKKRRMLHFYKNFLQKPLSKSENGDIVKQTGNYIANFQDKEEFL